MTKADQLTSRTGGNIADTYSYSGDPVWGDIMVASNAVETDSLFHAPALDGYAGADSTVTLLNGARYRTFRPQAPALSTPLTMSTLASSGVQFTSRTANRSATTGLTTSVQDGFNTLGVQYDGEDRPIVISGMSATSRYPNYTNLHTLSWVSYSASSLNTQFGRSYHYDAAGRIDAIGSPYAGTQRLFHYDQYGELTGADNQSGCSSSAPFDANSGYVLSCGYTSSSTTYTYDNVGNRTDLGASYYAGNRLALFSGGWYTYDADGNVNQKYLVQPNGHNQQFYWNPENRLDSLRFDGYYLVQYKYNAFGQPVEKFRQGALDAVWLWDGDQWLAEFNANNQRVSEYQYAGIDQPTASIEGATSLSSINYTEQDALGNVIGTHNGSTVTETISYDPWGMPSYSGDLASRTMWKGLIWEGGPNSSPSDVVGLAYMRGRWYDPQAGRFIQEDPLGVDGSVNLYGFAGDDPVNGHDPSGADVEISCRVDPIASYADGFSYYYDTACSITVTGGNSSDGDGPGDGHGGGGGAGGGSSGPGPQQPAPKPKAKVCPTSTALTAMRTVWASPNTALGLIAAGVSYAAGRVEGTNPSFQRVNNSLQLLNSPLNIGNRAYSLGNVQVYGVGNTNSPTSRNVSYTGVIVANGLHEEGHTVQAGILGPLYLPAWGLGRLFGGDSAGNPLERGADRYAQGLSCNGF